MYPPIHHSLPDGLAFFAIKLFAISHLPDKFFAQLHLAFAFCLSFFKPSA
jgi:hypothetical protein